MGEPIVKLILDLPPQIKEKIRRVAQKKGTSMKELIVKLIKDMPESEEKSRSTKYDRKRQKPKEKVKTSSIAS